MPSPNRQLVSFLIMAASLAVLAGLLFSRYLDKRREGETQVHSQLEAELTDRVDTWEERITDQLDGYLDDAVVARVDAASTEQRLRSHERWLDALYLWRPWRELIVSGRRVAYNGEFLYPMSPPAENKDRIYARPCMVRARLMTMDPRVNAEDLARAYLAGCGDEGAAVRMAATTEAATHLKRARMLDEALDAIHSSGVDIDLPLADAIREGLDPWRCVIQRIQRAEILQGLGRTDEALDQLEATGREITTLPAPVMRHGRLQSYVAWPIISELRAAGRDDAVRSLSAALNRADRRILAWQEIDERILRRRPTPSADGSRFIYDQYHETPFLLYYDSGLETGIGVGVQVDQPALLQDFLATMRRYRRHLVITDASGQLVAGSQRGGEIAITVPFPRTLTHLRVGLREAAVAQRMERFDDQFWPLVGLGAIVVIVASFTLRALYKANQGQITLLQRQREFTTRVTHELKTPLAGIRVMAENISAGAYRDDAHLSEMAGRIVDEADRLTERVDEVLSVTRERKIPKPEPFDPEEAVLEAIDTWGPRLEQAGLAMHADLHPTDEVNGDLAAVRDAVGCLLDNALKYRRDDIDAPQVWLTLSQRGAMVEIEVVDNGLGVPPKRRREIFERFVRVEGPNRGMAGGHGLGLAQVAAVAKRHHGEVTCTEGVDGGARFTLSLRTA